MWIPLETRNVTILCATLCAALIGGATDALGGPNLLTVCDSGCTHTTLQSAINSIGSSSSASNPYTILLEAQVHSTDTSISLENKSHITIMGRGIGASVLQGSAQWFANVSSASTGDSLLSLDGSTNITIHDLTIDALSQDPGNLNTSIVFAGVSVDDTDAILIQNAELKGFTYAIWDTFNNNAGALIQVFASKLLGVERGASVGAATWHFFACDVRARGDAGATAWNGEVFGLQQRLEGNVVAWATHFHGENGTDYPSTVAGALLEGGLTNDLFAIGSTLHAKVPTGTVDSSLRAFGLYAEENANFAGQVNVIGSDILYETLDDLQDGQVGGVWHSRATTDAELNLVGAAVIDVSGSTDPEGAGKRADVVYFGSGPASSNQAKVRAAGSKIQSYIKAGSKNPLPEQGARFQNTNMQSGTVTFGASTQVAVTLPTELPPSATYRVALSVDSNEVVWVTDKTSTGFTIRTAAASSATVDWILLR